MTCFGLEICGATLGVTKTTVVVVSKGMLEIVVVVFKGVSAHRMGN